jgi:hypothetical protein
MRATPKTIQPPRLELDKPPAKERIVEQALILFHPLGRQYIDGNDRTFCAYECRHDHQAFRHPRAAGFRFPEIAHEASGAIMEADRAGTPNDPEAQLRRWVLHSEFAADLSDQAEHAQLSRAAVDLMGIEAKNPLLTEIERFWQAERRKIAKLCEQARFRDPAALADKLLLLVRGARNERNCYGFAGPSQKVGEAGDDLMVAHGAQRKPLMEV